MTDKVELERMDWEQVKESSKSAIRTAMLNYELGMLSLKKAEEELKKFPDEKEEKTKPKITGVN